MDHAPTPLPVIAPVPTPTPSPFAEWIAGHQEVPPEMATALENTEWARDGLDSQEEQVIAVLISLTGPGQTPTLSEWLSMPFLRTVEAADSAALQALLSVRLNDPNTYQFIMDHETIGASITDEWAPIIAALPGPRQPSRGRYTVPEHLIDQLLDPNVVTVQMRTVSLPLAGTVAVSIVRTGAGSEETIERLVHAIRVAETFMHEAFPIGHVTMLVADWPQEAKVIAINNHHSLTISTVLDVGDGDPMAPQSKYIIAHETAHFYWTGHADWLDEGASELIARAATAYDVDPYRPQWVCENPEFASAERLESRQLSPEHPNYSCNYAIGLGTLMEMENDLGNPGFMRWLRSRYHNQP